jgi:DNA topoisomerase-1
MSKKYSTTTTLVIVESPAKCKKIEEYLGPGYKCIASYGHLRELSSLKNIDIENNYKPTYTIIDNALKKKQIEVLRKAIKSADEVILATDDDREGEAIAWHLCDIFKLDVNKTKRIIFHEITSTALQNSIKNQTIINMDIVNAQQARQILDLLVGFKISPILWKCIAKNKETGLSAGRCQTPALNIIYENYQEINESKEQKVYNTTGYFTSSNIPFELNKQYESEYEVTTFLNEAADFSHIYTCSQPIKTYKNPPEPFTTSRLQQVASNELHYSPKETMRICQILYEAGLITYMRTDSKTYSGDFIESVKTYITQTYIEYDKYIHKNIDLMVNGIIKDKDKDKNKDKDKETIFKKNTGKPSPQEAHEAIRPTQISLIELPKTMDSKERKMYKLIWENTLESCMTPASFYSITATISSFQNTKFTYSSELIDFPGWKIVSKKYTSDNKEFQYLQNIKQNSVIPYKKICSKVIVKGLKQHYTEARLVHFLEEKGIGRPSTFSSLVDKIQERGYVKKEDIKGKEVMCKDFELENDEIFEIDSKREFGNEKSKLVIQPLGILVIEFLNKNFMDLFHYDYTKLMEDSLDKVAKGQLTWFELCKKCHEQIDQFIDGLDTDTKIEIKIDKNNTYMIGKYGPVIKCVEEMDGKEEIQFKAVKQNVDIKLLEKGDYKIEDVIDTKKQAKSQYILGQYDGNDVVLKKGKFGLYISWGENSKTLKELGNRPIENITFDEVKKYLEEGSNTVRDISKGLSIKKGPKGDYLFYKNSKMKKPQFYDIKTFINETQEDYKICDMNMLKSWIKEKYNI